MFFFCIYCLFQKCAPKTPAGAMFIQVIVDDGFSMEEPVPKEIKARMLSGTAESESGL